MRFWVRTVLLSLLTQAKGSKMQAPACVNVCSSLTAYEVRRVCVVRLPIRAGVHTRAIEREVLVRDASGAVGGRRTGGALRGALLAHVDGRPVIRVTNWTGLEARAIACELAPPA